jgi:hypothetical protein
LTLDLQGSYTFSFEIPANADMSVLTISLQTFLGYKEKGSTAPFVSSFSVPILKKDQYTVEFYPEWSTEEKPLLAPNVPNKVYFQVHSISDDEDAKKEPEEFIGAELIQVMKLDDTQNQTTTIMQSSEIQHVHGGRSSFTFTPIQSSSNPKLGPATPYFYYLKVIKSVDDSSSNKSFLLPDVDTNQTFSITIDNNKQQGLGMQSVLDLKINTNDPSSDMTFNVSITNKDVDVFKGSVDLIQDQPFTPYSITFGPKLYSTAPNGGVLVLRIISVPKDNATKSVSFERLIFLNPLETTPFTVSTDKDDYEPGDKVVLDVDVGALNKVDDDEEYFASITVSDLSSYLQVPKAKLMPSLPAMTYLEKEIK